MVRVVADEMLEDRDLMPAAIEAVTDALQARAAGSLVSPPRHQTGFAPHGALVFTVGGTTGRGSRAGFRAYHTFGGVDSQLVAVWSVAGGDLEAIFVGHLLGDIRTGAIGGVATDHLSRADARTVAVIGSGNQARTQLEAAAVMRPLAHARVFSRDPDRRTAFAATMSTRLGLPVAAVSSAKEAVADADIVICATDSATPVIEAGWLKAGAHITTVGPKFADAHELDTKIAQLASIVTTDAPEQTRAYRRPFFLEGVIDDSKLIDLSDIVTGKLPGRTADSEFTLYCSAGLAGTEVLVAHRLLREIPE